MNRRPKTERIAASELRRHPRAQRTKESTAFAKRMAQDFNSDALGVLTGSRQSNGVVFLLDGFTRCEATILAGLEDKNLKVEVFEGLTRAEEHDLFLRLNTRKTVDSYARYTNGVAAGYPSYTATDQIIRQSGLTPSATAGDGRLAAVTKAVDIYDKRGSDILRETIGLALSAWGATDAAVEGVLLDGIAQVLDAYNGGIDKAALTKKLAKLKGGPHGLLAAARMQHDIDGRGVGKAVAHVITQRYNQGRRTGTLVG